MSLDERVSDFIRLIYESPYDPADWDRMARRLMELTHSNGLLISVVDAQHEQFSAMSFYGNEDSRFAEGIKDYAEWVCHEDPTLHFAAQNPNAGFCDSERSVPCEDYLSQPMTRWNNHCFGATHWIVGYTPPCDGLTLGVSLHTPAEVGHMRRSDERLFRMLFPHIVRAVTLAARPPQLAENHAPVMLVNALGHVVRANDPAQALAAEADAFQLEDGAIVPTHAGARTTFARLMDAALKPEIDEARSGGLKLPRRSKRLDLLALVDPLPHAATIAGAMGAEAVVRFVDPANRGCPMEVQRRLFDFTKREAEVAELLLAGHSVESIGHTLKISPATVRIHLRALFRKTDTDRQSDLINLLLRVS